MDTVGLDLGQLLDSHDWSSSPTDQLMMDDDGLMEQMMMSPPSGSSWSSFSSPATSSGSNDTFSSADLSDFVSISDMEKLFSTPGSNLPPSPNGSDSGIDVSPNPEYFESASSPPVTPLTHVSVSTGVTAPVSTGVTAPVSSRCPLSSVASAAAVRGVRPLLVRAANRLPTSTGYSCPAAGATSYSSTAAGATSYSCPAAAGSTTSYSSTATGATRKATIIKCVPIGRRNAHVNVIRVKSLPAAVAALRPTVQRKQMAPRPVLLPAPSAVVAPPSRFHAPSAGQTIIISPSAHNGTQVVIKSEPCGGGVSVDGDCCIVDEFVPGRRQLQLPGSTDGGRVRTGGGRRTELVAALPVHTVGPSGAVSLQTEQPAAGFISTASTCRTTQLDSRQLKKQQLILRNRLAASQSRQRKRQQLVQLETRVGQLHMENDRLRSENQSLHLRVAELQAEVDMLRTCHSPPSSPPPLPCHGSPSTFSAVGSPSTFSAVGSPSTFSTAGSGPARSSVMLLSMLLLTGLNIGWIGVWPRGAIQERMALSSSDGDVGFGQQRPLFASSAGSRTLLWAREESDVDADGTRFGGGNATLAGSGNGTVGGASAVLCAEHMNQTEVRRLSRAMHGLFDPAAAPDEAETGRETPSDPAFPLWRDQKQRQRRQRPSFVDPSVSVVTKRRRSRRPAVEQPDNPLSDWLYRPFSSAGHRLETDSVGLFGAPTGPDDSFSYGPFIDAIGRQPDRFYVVSLNGDHLLLPAIAYNSTQRPRMSLLLPSISLNDSLKAPAGFVAMVEIDCEVVDTRLLHVKQSLMLKPRSQQDGKGSRSRTATASASSRNVTNRASVGGAAKRGSKSSSAGAVNNSTIKSGGDGKMLARNASKVSSGADDKEGDYFQAQH